MSQTTLYSTGFEPLEGYDPNLTLAGQNGWVGYGSGGNGIVSNYFADLGHQGYVGYTAPQGTNDFLSIYRPVNIAPIPTNQPVLKFSVLMQIVDSTTTNRDDFRWSLYNTNGTRLFSVDFDNSTLLISYLLEEGGFIPAQAAFDNEGYYEFVVTMNFARNLWSAALNDVSIINAQPITTRGSPLNFGDFDAVWFLVNPRQPGDNFMLFDEYTITTESGTSIPPRLEVQGLSAQRACQIQLHGEPGLNYQIQVSTNLRDWQPLLTLTAPANGELFFEDPSAVTMRGRFYRAEQAR